VQQMLDVATKFLIAIYFFMLAQKRQLASEAIAFYSILNRLEGNPETSLFSLENRGITCVKLVNNVKK